HTLTDTHTHTLRDTHTLTDTHTHTHPQTHTHTPTYTHSQRHTHTHSHTHTRSQITTHTPPGCPSPRRPSGLRPTRQAPLPCPRPVADWQGVWKKDSWVPLAPSCLTRNER